MGAAVSGIEPRRDMSQAFAILGQQPDKFRLFWTDADEPTRRFLLQIAKQPTWLSGDSWDKLGPETRGAIKRRAVALRDWLVKVLPC